MADIEAHITGNVWKITCVVGDTIKDGHEVVILESMKMEIPVESEDDGVVKEIKVKLVRHAAVIAQSYWQPPKSFLVEG